MTKQALGTWKLICLQLHRLQRHTAETRKA
jgi:hypothetical protein